MQRIPEYMLAHVFRAMRAVPMHPEFWSSIHRWGLLNSSSLVCPWPPACVYLSTPEPWCVVFVQMSVCVYVATLNPCTYTVRARVHASSPVPGAVPQQTEHWSSIPRIEVQYSRIQDSRFKVPAQSFPRILNLESWIRGSIELQSRGLNFNTPGSKIQDSRFQHKVSPGSWILHPGEYWTSILGIELQYSRARSAWILNLGSVSPIEFNRPIELNRPHACIVCQNSGCIGTALIALNTHTHTRVQSIHIRTHRVVF